MQANGIGLYLDDYVEAIKKVAAYFSIPCLDLYATANLHPYDAANIAMYYSSSDQLHPNAEGHQHLANVMMAFFETLADKRGQSADTHIHRYTETVTTAATCTTAGIKTFTCDCGYNYTQSIPATGHKWNAGFVTVEPTKETEGVRTYTCTVCGATRTETIPAIHTHSYTSAIVEPTCTEQGYTQYICSCGHTYKDNYVPATGHDYADGDCSVCGAVGDKHLVHNFEGINATQTAWVDSVDATFRFDFTGSPSVENGVVAFSKNSYGVLNKPLDTKDIDTTLAIKVKMDNDMTNTWSFGCPNWQNGFILGKYGGFGVDANHSNPLGIRISGECLHSNANRNLKLTDADSNYHLYVGKYIKAENVTYWYCDGILVGSFRNSVITNWLADVVHLNNEGSQYRGNNSFEYIKIWECALTDDQIAMLV